MTAAPEPLLGARSSTTVPAIGSRADALPAVPGADIVALELPDPPPRA
jgi:hypothetical protein